MQTIVKLYFRLFKDIYFGGVKQNKYNLRLGTFKFKMDNHFTFIYSLNLKYTCKPNRLTLQYFLMLLETSNKRKK